MSQAGRFLLGSGLSPVETLTGNTGGPVPPTGGNINVIGAGAISVAGNPGTSTLTISQGGSVATTYQTDAGDAVPAGGILEVLGAHGLNTTGALNVVTVLIDNAIT